MELVVKGVFRCMIMMKKKILKVKIVCQVIKERVKVYLMVLFCFKLMQKLK